MKHAGIFLDRDGTINEEVDFLSSPHDLHLIPRSAEAISHAQQMGFKIFIVTNQSGVARGIITEEQLQEIHATLQSKLAEHGAHVDAVYYCPHHPDFGEARYRLDCDCRKPRTGMMEQAAREYSIDLTRSFVIGDRLIDIQMGNAVGVPSVLVLTGYGKKELVLCREQNANIAYVAPDLFDAVQFIQRHVQLQQPSIG